MPEVPLRRRIPPLSVEDLTAEFMDLNLDLSHYDAQALAVETYAENMRVIYRLARIGETFERLEYCPGGDPLPVIHPDSTSPVWRSATPYWQGYASGWNGAQQWVRDNMEDTSATR